MISLLMLIPLVALVPGAEGKSYDITIQKDDHWSKEIEKPAENEKEQRKWKITVDEMNGTHFDVYILEIDEFEKYKRDENFTARVSLEYINSTGVINWTNSRHDPDHYLVVDNRDNSRDTDVIAYRTIKVHITIEKEGEEWDLGGIFTALCVGFCLLPIIVIILIFFWIVLEPRVFPQVKSRKYRNLTKKPAFQPPPPNPPLAPPHRIQKPLPPQYPPQTPPYQPPPQTQAPSLTAPQMQMQAPLSNPVPLPKSEAVGNILKATGAGIIYIVLWSIGLGLLAIGGIIVIPLLWGYFGTSMLVFVIPVAIPIVIFLWKDSKIVVSKEVAEQMQRTGQTNTGLPAPPFPPKNPPVLPPLQQSYSPQDPPPPLPQYPPQGQPSQSLPPQPRQNPPATSLHHPSEHQPRKSYEGEEGEV